MAEFESLKPSNTGWLIADVVPDTFAFSWSRLEPDPALIALLSEPRWEPYLVFPCEFVTPDRVVFELLADKCAIGATGACGEKNLLQDEAQDVKRPLFILLDGTWSEARKIFRKSPYLDKFPVLSLQAEQLSRYRLRRSTRAHHFCTLEVAAMCLALAGEHYAADTLEAYLDVFSSRYLRARQSLLPDVHDAAHRRLQDLSIRTP